MKIKIKNILLILILLTFLCGTLAAQEKSPSVAAEKASTTVKVEAEVKQQPTSISVNTSAVDFGLLDPVAAGKNRFSSPTINCSWNAPKGSTWEIKVSTTNSKHFPGIVDPTENHFLPLKLNHEDLGSNNPEVDANWSGDSASFIGVFDPAEDDKGPGSDGFLTTFTKSGQRPDIGNLDFKFAIEVLTDAHPTSYSGNVTLELIIDSLPKSE